MVPGIALIPKSLILAIQPPLFGSFRCGVDRKPSPIGVSMQGKYRPTILSLRLRAHEPDIALLQRLSQIQRRAVARETGPDGGDVDAGRQWECAAREASRLEIENADAARVEEGDVAAVPEPARIRAGNRASPRPLR